LSIKCAVGLVCFEGEKYKVMIYQKMRCLRISKTDEQWTIIIIMIDGIYKEERDGDECGRGDELINESLRSLLVAI